MRRFRRMVVFIRTTLFLATSLLRAAAMHLAGGGHMVRRCYTTTDLVIETRATLLIGDLLRRASLALPVSATLHRRCGTFLTLASSSFCSANRSRWSRGTSSNAGSVTARNRHAGSMVVLLVGICRARRGWTLVPDRSDLRWRRERATIGSKRRARSRSAVRASRRSGSTARRATDGGRVGSGVGTSTIMRLWRRSS